MLSEDTCRGNPNDPLSLNLYTYCKNNPVWFFDPSGLTPVDIYEFINALIEAGEIESFEYSWTANGDQYTIIINGYTLTYDGSGKNKHNMNIWVENGKIMAQDYDIAYFFRSTGWVEYMPGFEWEAQGQLFRVDTHLYFLSQSFSADFAKEVMSLRSTDFWGGLTASDIAKECYAHAVMLMHSSWLKYGWDRAESWYASAEVIDIAPNDPRQSRFNTIWNLGIILNQFANGKIFKNNEKKK